MKYIIFQNETYLWNEEAEQKIRETCELWANYFDTDNEQRHPLCNKGWKTHTKKNSTAIKHIFKIVRGDNRNASKKQTQEISYTIYNFADVNETLNYAKENFENKKFFTYYQNNN